MDGDRPFPQAVEAERALLGGLMSAADELGTIQDELRPEHFYRPEHGELFKLLVEMLARGDAIDLVTVSERILRGGNPDRFGGAGYVAELPEHAPSTANLPHYAVIVREKAVLRELIRVTTGLTQRAFDQPDNVAQLLDEAGREVTSLGTTAGGPTWVQISEVADKELRTIETRAENPGTTTGATTGFSELDEVLAGLHPTDLFILAARPAMGKTALALNLAANVAIMDGVTVGVFSLEMSRDQLVNRMLCCQALVEGDKVRTGRLGTDDWDRLLDASEHLRRASVHLDDSSNLSIGDVRARARRLKAQHPDLSLIVIDYLQLMRGDDPKAPREQQISSISRGLKGLAKDLQCCVMALSQLNRSVEQRADKRPLLSDLRESGAIEQDADVIAFIYRDEYYNKESPDKGLAEVIVAKQRRGSTKTVKLAYQPQFTRFDNFLSESLGV
jgi:replicative DNA helicase